MTTEKLYAHILVPLENSPADETILQHVKRLARLCGARLTLIHVADGFMARNQERLAESEEMDGDGAYIESRRAALEAEGFEVAAVLECGEPADRILAFAERNACDLITMATHGHRGLTDVILGSVASSVRHRTNLPVLLLRAHLK